MNSEKPYKAYSGHSRTSGFLLGLVTVLATFLVLLEYTTQESPYEGGKDALEDLSQDVEMMPFIQRKDMVAAGAARPEAHAMTQVRVVEDGAEKAPDDMPADGEETETTAHAGTGATGTASAEDSTEDRTTALAPVAVDEDDNPLNFTVVERLPEFPGGMVEFMKWLTKNLRYPAQAQQQKIQGKVLVAFIVNKDGSIADPKVVASAGPELDREALRVIRMMPKWKPGEDRGKPCRTYFRIPIVFKL